jgi:hypothetical protein
MRSKLALTRAHGTTCRSGQQTYRETTLRESAPVDGTVDKLLSNSDVTVLASSIRDTTNGLSEETIGNGEDV